MELFRLENGLAVLDNPGVSMVKEFKAVIRRDLHRDKRRAFQELAYVYMMCDHRSPFFNESPNKRSDAVKKELRLEKDWEPDDLVLQAMAKYELLMETPVIRLLKKARASLEKMEVYFEKVNFEDRNEKTNALIFTPKELMGAIADIADAHEGLDKLEELIKKQMVSRSRVRGGGEIGAFEE